MNPVLFIAVFVDKISVQLKEDLRNTYSMPDSGGRLLSASLSEDDWCTGTHLLDYASVCAEYNEQLRATTVFMVASSSAIMALVFLVLGVMKLTRYIAYVPTSIID